MSNTIEFLETMGQDATLCHAREPELETALVDAKIDVQLRSAILGKDPTKIAVLLGAKAVVCCAFAPGKDHDDEEEAPGKDDDEIRAHLTTRAIASAA